MYLLIILGVLIVLFKLDYNRFSKGLRDPPKYYQWLVTKYLHLKGWTTEEYCLSTNNLQSDGTLGYLSDKDIPQRIQIRPKMLRALPQRQLNQRAPDEIMYAMNTYLESISIRRYGGQTLDDKTLLFSDSSIEYTGDPALFVPSVNEKPIENGEFAHIHSNDGSFHMILHPLDAKLLIEKQWAERFPLAGRTLFGTYFPISYILVYAPQNETELKLWKKILHASIDYNQAKKKKH